jgi:hypothetical protein
VREPQGVAGAERRLTRRQLVERRAHRVQVGTLIHRPACTPGLLGRQVRQRPHDLAVVRELGTNLGERGRQGEVQQARGAAAGDHDVRRRDVPVHHPPAVHPGDRPGQRHRKPDQVIGGQRLRQAGQARVTDVLHHDRSRVPRRIQQLRDSLDTAQPLEDRHLMPQPALCVRPQRLLADDRAPSEAQPRDARVFALVD